MPPEAPSNPERYDSYDEEPHHDQPSGHHPDHHPGADAPGPPVALDEPLDAQREHVPDQSRYDSWDPFDPPTGQGRHLRETGIAPPDMTTTLYTALALAGMTLVVAVAWIATGYDVLAWVAVLLAMAASFMGGRADWAHRMRY